jgi:ribosomal-protein-alanine N-acetyltransferase
VSAGEPSIRLMKASDISHILEIERVSFITPWTEHMFRSQLMLGDISINIVLTEDESIVGYLVAWVAYDELHILSIAVVPERRRKGYAVRLMDDAIERGTAKGIKKVVLEVREGNVAPQLFYRKYGFRVIGKRARYYSDTGEDAIVMELRLDEP